MLSEPSGIEAQLVSMSYLGESLFVEFTRSPAMFPVQNLDGADPHDSNAPFYSLPVSWHYPSLRSQAIICPTFDETRPCTGPTLIRATAHAWITMNGGVSDVQNIQLLQNC